MTRSLERAIGGTLVLLGALVLLLQAPGAGGAESLALGSDSPTWAPDGSMLAFVGFRAGRPGDIYSIRRDGRGERRLTKTTAHEDTPRWSHDGRRIVFVRGVGLGRQLFVMNADGTGVRQLTHGDQPSFAPAWSPDDTRIAFARGRDHDAAADSVRQDETTLPPEDANRGDAADIWVIGADGSGLTRLTQTPAIDISPTFSPDGTLIAFTSNRAGTGAQHIYTMSPDGSDQRKLTDNPITFHNEYRPSWSPDGSSLAFVADRDPPAGSLEIYAVEASGRNMQRLTWNAIHDDWPSWSRNGELAVTRGRSAFRPEVFVMSADGSLARRITGSDLHFVRLTHLPRAPRAAKRFTVELTVRPALDDFTDIECTATLEDQLLPDAVTRVVAGRLRCMWTLPRSAKGKRLSGVVLASSRGSEVVRTFSVRVR